MNYKEPPRVLELVNEEVAERVTNLTISIGMGEMRDLPILISSQTTNTMISCVVCGNISFLSSSDRLQVTSRILEELE
jgi:hypothetical protein